MKAGDWTGIQGIPTQDMAMWESMGPISDRSQDHPGSSDLAVAQFRRMVLAAAKKFQEGGAGARHRREGFAGNARFFRRRGAEDHRLALLIPERTEGALARS